MERTASTQITLDRSPLISVLMSVHNGERFLSESVESILGQTLEDFELVVIDDGSSDGSWSLLQAYAARDPRIRLFRNSANIGLTRSLNRGLEHVAGKYIARQDSDDVSLPCRLLEQAALLEGDHSLVIVGSACQVIDERGDVIRTDRYPATDTAIRWRMLFDNPFVHSSVMIRRQALVAHDLTYDEGCCYSQDYELWSRLLYFGSGANCTKPLVRYRTHDLSLGKRFAASQEKIACDIARSNIRALGSDMPLEELRTLKMWERDEIVKHGENFKKVLGSLLALIDLYARHHQDDREGVREIRSSWMIRGLRGFPLSRLLAPGYARLFLHILFLEPLGFCSRFSGYLRRKASPTFRSLFKAIA